MFIDERQVHGTVPEVTEKAYFGLLAGFGGLATVALLVFGVATQSGADAERIANARSGSIPDLVSAFAAIQGRPGGH